MPGKIVNTNGEDPELRSLPKYDVVTVGKRKALIAGLCIRDKSIYSAQGSRWKPFWGRGWDRAGLKGNPPKMGLDSKASEASPLEAFWFFSF